MSEHLTHQPETTTSEAPQLREISPMATRIRAAAERIGTFLEKRALNNAHDSALKEYRDRDHSDYVDYVSSLADNAETDEARDFNASLLRSEERRSDREALIEAGTEKLKNLGFIALGATVMGYEAARDKTAATYSEKRETVLNKLAVRTARKNIKKYDKYQEKENKKVIKQAGKNIKLHDKIVTKAEKREKRLQAIERGAEKLGRAYAGSREAALTTLETGAAKAGEVYRYGGKKKRQLGAFALRAQEAGSATWNSRTEK